MTRSVLLATAAATLAVALTACGGEGASDAAPSASSTVSTSARGTAPAPGTVAPTTDTTSPADEEPEPATSPAPETTAAPTTAAPTTAAPTTAEPCAVVTREYLITTLRMTASPDIPLADLQNARCSGNYATALSQPKGTLHPVVYMFKYSAPVGWRLMGVDDAIDCVNRHGVPLEDARVIGCAL
ncbi:hypothetical protein ACFQZZ_04475 [Nocardia sp. GCM10030253]|uniref:hypothetical protein n=1 Tax=Nocardia sp. GCM10030253 TaxID=3273404 RepID=UPI00362E854A